MKKQFIFVILSLIAVDSFALNEQGAQLWQNKCSECHLNEKNNLPNNLNVSKERIVNAIKTVDKMKELSSLSEKEIGYIVEFLNVSVPASTLYKKERIDELKRLEKCYALFVRSRISNTNQLWKDVASGAKNGTDACMELFDTAKLDENGFMAPNSDGRYDDEHIGVRVMSSFLRFHKAQFEIQDYHGTVGADNDRFTRNVTDTNENVYHFLYSVFGSNQKFSDLVTRDFSLRSKRFTPSGQERTRIVGALGRVLLNPFGQGINATSLDSGTPFNPLLAETGLLVGLVPDDADSSLNPTIKNQFDPTINMMDSMNVHQHHGAGLIGSQAYLLGNLGKEDLNDGGLVIQRRWAKHLLSDLLCRDLPALRSVDVIPEVNVESKLPFRSGISCMGCHSSMDPLSGVVRNMLVGRSIRGQNDLVRMSVKFIGKRPPEFPFDTFPVLEGDMDFYKRPTWGKVFYRSFDGSLINYEVNGLEELGQKLAESNDLYVCAVKRYYKVLTGINVSLADPGNINTPAFTDGEKILRERIVKLGLELKEHQSFKEVLKKIIQSEAFIRPEQGI